MSKTPNPLAFRCLKRCLNRQNQAFRRSKHHFRRRNTVSNAVQHRFRQLWLSPLAALRRDSEKGRSGRGPAASAVAAYAAAGLRLARRADLGGAGLHNRGSSMRRTGCKTFLCPKTTGELTRKRVASGFAPVTSADELLSLCSKALTCKRFLAPHLPLPRLRPGRRSARRRGRRAGWRTPRPPARQRTAGPLRSPRRGRGRRSILCTSGARDGSVREDTCRLGPRTSPFLRSASLGEQRFPRAVPAAVQIAEPQMYY